MFKRRTADWIDSYLSYTDNTEPPESFRRWVAISAIAAALQRKVWLDWGNTFYPNMYVVLVAPPGRARKGTAISPMLKMLTRLTIPLAAESITREALIRAMKEAESTATLASGEAVVHASLTVVSPELTVFLGYNNTTLLSDLTDWFDCRDTWQYRTKNSGTDDITGVYLNLLGATTPDLLRTTLPLDAIGGGLTSRMIFIYERDKGKIVPLPFLSVADKKLGEDLLHDLSSINMMKGPFQATPDFLNFYAEWYTAQENNPPFRNRSFSGYIERRPTHVLKLSQILCAARTDSMIIDICDIEKAVAILTLAEEKMEMAFGGVGENKHAHIVQAILTDIGLEKSISVTNLVRRYWRDVNVPELMEIIKTVAKISPNISITTRNLDEGPVLYWRDIS